MLNLGRPGRGKGYRDDIETSGLVKKIVEEQIALGDLADLRLFSPGDGLGGKVGGAGVPGLDFDKDQVFALLGNYIDFPIPLPVVSDKDAVAAFLQVPDRQIFPFFSKCSTFIRQIPSPRERFFDVRGMAHG